MSSLLESDSREHPFLCRYSSLAFVDLLTVRDDPLEALYGLGLVPLVEHLRVELNISEWLVLAGLERVALALSRLVGRGRVLDEVALVLLLLGETLL